MANPANAQTEALKNEVQETAAQWAATERSGDTAVQERMLASDFIGVGPRGFTLTKDEWIARYRSGDLRNESFEWNEVSVRVYGDAAVVIGRQTTQGTYQGQQIGGSFRTTLAFVRQDGQWRLAGLHLSPIAGPP